MTIEGNEGKSLVPAQPTKVEPVTLLDRVNRVVVYGSNLSGAGDLRDGLYALLRERGIPDSSVRLIRNVDLIERGFFGLSLDLPDVVHPSGEAHTLPRGVVIFHEMRFYDSAGMTVSTFEDRFMFDGKTTPFDKIRRLCEQFDVPYITVRRENMPDSLADGINSFVLPDSSSVSPQISSNP